MKDHPFWIRQYPYNSHIFLINLSLRFISRFGRFHEDSTLKEETVPLPFSRNRPENNSHNLGKALGKGLGLHKTGSLSLSRPLSPFYPFHLSIPFTSLPFHLSITFTSLFLSPLSLSLYLSLPLYISPFTFLSLSLLSIILLGVSNGRFRPCLSVNQVANHG